MEIISIDTTSQTLQLQNKYKSAPAETWYWWQFECRDDANDLADGLYELGQYLDNEPLKRRQQQFQEFVRIRTAFTHARQDLEDVSKIPDKIRQSKDNQVVQKLKEKFATREQVQNRFNELATRMCFCQYMWACHYQREKSFARTWDALKMLEYHLQNELGPLEPTLGVERIMQGRWEAPSTGLYNMTFTGLDFLL